MSLVILRAELLNDPVALGYAGKTDQQCLDLLAAKNRSRFKALVIMDLLEWAGASQRYLALKDAANVAANSQTKNMCAVFLLLLGGPPGAALDLKNQSFKNMVDALVTASVLSAADRAALNTMATENINRFAELGIPEYQLGDITRARTGTA